MSTKVPLTRDMHEFKIINDLCQVMQLFSTWGICAFITKEFDVNEHRTSIDRKINKYFARHYYNV